MVEIARDRPHTREPLAEAFVSTLLAFEMASGLRFRVEYATGNNRPAGEGWRVFDTSCDPKIVWRRFRIEDLDSGEERVAQ
jgi:hypothetical protein